MLKKIIVLALWTGIVLIVFRLLGYAIGGRFEKYWFNFAVIAACAAGIIAASPQQWYAVGMIVIGIVGLTFETSHWLLFIPAAICFVPVVLGVYRYCFHPRNADATALSASSVRKRIGETDTEIMEGEPVSITKN